MVDAEQGLFALKQIEAVVQSLGQNPLIQIRGGSEQGKAAKVVQQAGGIASGAIGLNEAGQPLAEKRRSQVVSPAGTQRVRRSARGEKRTQGQGCGQGF